MSVNCYNFTPLIDLLQKSWYNLEHVFTIPSPDPCPAMSISHLPSVESTPDTHDVFSEVLYDVAVVEDYFDSAVSTGFSVRLAISSSHHTEDARL